jgi:hypothetical protein
LEFERPSFKFQLPRCDLVLFRARGRQLVPLPKCPLILSISRPRSTHDRRPNINDGHRLTGTHTHRDSADEPKECRRPKPGSVRPQKLKLVGASDGAGALGSRRAAVRVGCGQAHCQRSKYSSNQGCVRRCTALHCTYVDHSLILMPNLSFEPTRKNTCQLLQSALADPESPHACVSSFSNENTANE